ACDVVQHPALVVDAPVADEQARPGGVLTSAGIGDDAGGAGLVAFGAREPAVGWLPFVGVVLSHSFPSILAVILSARHLACCRQQLASWCWSGWPWTSWASRPIWSSAVCASIAATL